MIEILTKNNTVFLTEKPIHFGHNFIRFYSYDDYNMGVLPDETYLDLSDIKMISLVIN